MSGPDRAPAPAGALFLAARAALARLDRLSYGAIVAAMAAMAMIVAVQVVFRYLLDSAIDSSEELARLFFVWAMFLAVPHGVRRGVHVGIEAVVSLLPANRRAQVFRLNNALGAAFMALVCTVTLPVIAGKWAELMPTLDVTAAVYYFAVLIATGHSCLHLLLFAWGGPRCWEGEEAPA